MAEIEERPSKIRKLDTASSDAVQVDEEHRETPDTPMTEATNHLEGEKNGDANGAGEQNGDAPKLSKSQLKKLKRREDWEAGKEYRRVKRREKHKAKQAKKAEDRAELQAKIASGEIEAPPAPKIDSSRLNRPVQVPVSFILDCDFNELMTEKELISLGAQLTRCYSDNRSNPYRSHFAVSSWGGSLKERFETKLASHHLSWKGVRFVEGDFEVAAEELNAVMRGPEGGRLAGAIEKTQNGVVANTDIKEEETEEPKADTTEEMSIDELPAEVVVEPLPSSALQPTEDGQPAATSDDIANPSATGTTQTPNEAKAPSLPAEPLPRPSIVYLSSDSDETLTELLPNTSYIIGGIVDKNRHKGICHKRACERGIPTAKLPIGEFMLMQSRSVLAVNHVMEIMLKWLETGDWGEAFLAVIPKRKEAKLRVKSKAEKGEHSDEDGESEREETEGSTGQEIGGEKADEANIMAGDSELATPALDESVPVSGN